MKVLMFGWELPPFNSGGLCTACLGLTRALAQQGIEVSFVLPKVLPLYFDFLKLLFADIPELRTSAYGGSGSGFDLFEEVRAYSERARQLARREKFDLIHSHDWLTFGAGIAAKEVSGKPLVVHIHATEFDRTGGHGINPLVYAVEKEGMRAAAAVVAVSGFTKRMIVENYQIEPAKVRVVWNGIDSNDYPPLPAGGKDLLYLKKLGRKIVIFVGRLTLQKGPDYFLRAAKMVLERRPETIFVIAGNGDMEAQLIHQTIALGLSQKVFFAGFLRGEELRRLYRAADLFVLPSVSEPFGITPLEALVNGAPVLISKQSGVSEVLNHALKVDFWDVEEMANKIMAVLDYPPLGKELKNAGGAEAREANWEKAARKCFNLYEEVLTG